MDLMDMTWTDSHGNDNESIDSIPEHEHPAYRYAGFWMRFWAYLIDVVVLFGLKGILLSPIAFIPEQFSLEIGFWTWNGILSGIVFYLYFFCMTKFFQQTVGKIIIGLKVIKEDDSTLTVTDILFREVIGRMIYNIIGVLKLLYIVIGFTNEKQGLHDMIGKTRVIHVE